jgi:hypothetical protein
VDAEMKRIPREGCPEALPAVQNCRPPDYFRIHSEGEGADRGREGAPPDQSFLSMGPVAVQGYFAAHGKKGRPGLPITRPSPGAQQLPCLAGRWAICAIPRGGL